VGLGAPTTTVRRSGALEFTVAFAASGSPLPGSQGTLEVADGAAVRYVVVAAVTGRVRASSTPWPRPYLEPVPGSVRAEAGKPSRKRAPTS
jgi:hypothetical protein